MFTAELIRSQPDLWKYNLVWMKDRVSGHLNANRMPLRQHEDIVVFYKKLPVYHPQMSYKPGQKNHPRGHVTKRTDQPLLWRNEATRSHISDWKYPTSIVCIPREFKTGCFYHPTQKPVKLIEYLIKTYTDEGDTVLDNCIGRTTAVAAIRTGRHYIGFEIDRTYCEIAERRIRGKR